jgi:Mu-like prophage I protein
LPWHVEKDPKACSLTKPWAVKNSDTGATNGRCHESKEKAQAQMRALYASYRREGKKLGEIFLAPVEKLFGEGDSVADNVRWVQAFPYDSWSHPTYGVTTVTKENGQQYVKNFKENVRGQDLPVGFNHGVDLAKGEKAAGWIRDVEARDEGVFVKVEFTPPAVEELKNGEWKYFSSESFDEWEHPHTKEKHKYVLAGGSLTNKPWVKGMLPINFSEVLTEEDKKKMETDIEAAKTLLVGSGFEVTGESKEWEHSEPGTGNPPQPRTEDDGSDDVAIRERWRVTTPPIANPEEVQNAKGGNIVGELTEKDLRELLKVADVDDEGKLVETVKLAFGELSQLKHNQDAATQEKEFSERYPQYWDEHNKLMAKTRSQDAKAFSESVSRVRKAHGNGLVETRQGLSTVAKEKIEELHKKFAENNATPEEFEDCIKTIMNGGLLEFGEIGTSKNGEDDIPEIDSSSATGIAGNKKLFAEVLAKVQKENPDLTWHQAYAKAAEKHPDLAEASRVALPA